MLRCAVVTGAGGRVGRAIALELADAGYDLCVHYRGSESGARETVRACKDRGRRAWAFGADLSLVGGCEALVSAVQARWSGLDILVNNASLFEPRRFEAIRLSDWDRMMNINLRAPFLLSQGLLPSLRASKGLILHLCDIGGERPLRGYAPYSVSKAGLLMLVKAMAVELAPEVRTIGISPGQVIWPDDYGPELREKLAERVPMKRVGTPQDVARLVRFLALEGGYLNGQNIAVDGGLSIRY